MSWETQPWKCFAAGDVFLFDGFRLDRRGGGLSRRDERGDFGPMATGSRALDVLGVLVERPGDLVSMDAIMTVNQHRSGTPVLPGSTV